MIIHEIERARVAFGATSGKEPSTLAIPASRALEFAEAIKPAMAYMTPTSKAHMPDLDNDYLERFMGMDVRLSIGRTVFVK